MLPKISVTLSEDPDAPTYLEAVKVTTLENVEEVQIRLVKTLDGPEEPFLTDIVSKPKDCNLMLLCASCPQVLFLS